MFHVEVNLIYFCYLVHLVFLMRPSRDQPDVPCGPREEKFAHPCSTGRLVLMLTSSDSVNNFSISGTRSTGLHAIGGCVSFFLLGLGIGFAYGLV